MAGYSISVDLDEFPSAIQYAVTQTISGVTAAVEQTVSEAQVAWQSAVLKAPGHWMGKKDYVVGSIQTSMYSPLSGEVYSELKAAIEMEEGTPAKDLKDMLNTSKKTRMSKSGKKYLIIPFRHNTPGNSAHAMPMPPAIYQQAKALAPSRVVGLGTRMNASGGTVAQAIYKWGGALPAGLSPKMKPHHTTDIHAGMRRFDTSSGGQKSSAYLTFRVMMEGSPKWIVQAKPGLYLAKAVADAMQARLVENVSKAVAAAL